MTIEKLRRELLEYEFALSRIPATSTNIDDKIARGMFEDLIGEIRNKLARMGVKVPDPGSDCPN